VRRIVKKIVSHSAGPAGRFRSSEGGMAAVEFALVLPFMVTLYFGLITLTDGYAIKQRIELTSRTVSDLTGRLNTGVINDGEVDNISTASAAIMAPYNAEGMIITLASVVVRAKGSGVEGQVCWSASREVQGGLLGKVTPPPNLVPDTIVTVPEGYRQAGSSYIVSEVKFTYKPVLGHAISGDINFRDELPWPVRNVQQVSWAGQPACSLTPVS
jgi:Flp pilus assembly protein TadG